LANNGVTVEQPPSSIDTQDTSTSNNVRLAYSYFYESMFSLNSAIRYSTTIGSINVN
jgi:hypothetical protein